MLGLHPFHISTFNVVRGASGCKTSSYKSPTECLSMNKSFTSHGHIAVHPGRVKDCHAAVAAKAEDKGWAERAECGLGAAFPHTLTGALPAWNRSLQCNPERR